MSDLKQCGICGKLLLNPIRWESAVTGRGYCSLLCWEQVMIEVIEKARSKTKDPDPVNSPSHYNQGKVECIEALEAALTTEEFRGFCKGNALKYLWREKGKGGQQDLEKAKWYLERLKSQIKSE